MESPGRRKREGLKGCVWMRREREDMAGAEMTEEDAADMTEWIWKIRCGDLGREKPI